MQLVRILKSYVPNPTQKSAHALLLKHSSFFLYFIHHQTEVENWLQSKTDAKFSENYNRIKGDFFKPENPIYEIFKQLLNKIRYDVDEKSIHDAIYDFLGKHEVAVKLFNDHKHNPVLDAFLDDQVDIKCILPRTFTFYINFAFFYDEFALWILSKNDNPDLQQAYVCMMKDFWETIKNDYANFVNALAAQNNGNVEALHQLIASRPKVAAFLKRYDNSCVITAFNKKLQNKTTEKYLTEIRKNAIKIYQEREEEKKQGSQKSPPNSLKSTQPPIPSAKPRYKILANLTKDEETTFGRTYTVFLNGTCSEKDDYKNPMYGKNGETVSHYAHVMDTNNPKKEYIDFARLDGPGTGHKRQKEFLRYAQTYTVFMGQAFGYGMAENIQQGIDCIKFQAQDTYPKEKWVAERIQLGQQQPKITRVNIAGWSRGAVESIELGNKIADEGDLKQVGINLFLFDPVPGPYNTRESNLFINNNKIDYCYIILSQDERSAAFNPLIPRLAPSNSHTKIIIMSLPGHHGTLVGNPFWRHSDSKGCGRKVEMMTSSLGPSQQTVKPSNNHPQKKTYYDLTHVGELARHIMECLLIKHGTELYKRDEKNQVVNKSKRNYSLLGLYFLVKMIEKNIAGYRLLGSVESYTRIETGDRNVIYSNDNSTKIQRLGDIPELQSSDELGNLVEEIKSEFFEYLKKFKNELQRKVQRLETKHRIMSLRVYTGQLGQFCKEYHVSPYEYLGISYPSGLNFHDVIRFTKFKHAAAFSHQKSSIKQQITSEQQQTLAMISNARDALLVSLEVSAFSSSKRLNYLYHKLIYSPFELNLIWRERKKSQLALLPHSAQPQIETLAGNDLSMTPTQNVDTLTPVEKALITLKSFISQAIDNKTTSTTIIKIKELLKTRNEDPTVLFTQCRKIIEDRLNSTVGNFLATHSFLFFSKRSEKMDQFYREFSKVKLTNEEKDSTSISIEQFETNLNEKLFTDLTF